MLPTYQNSARFARGHAPARDLPTYLRLRAPRHACSVRAASGPRPRNLSTLRVFDVQSCVDGEKATQRSAVMTFIIERNDAHERSRRVILCSATLKSSLSGTTRRILSTHFSLQGSAHKHRPTPPSLPISYILVHPGTWLHGIRSSRRTAPNALRHDDVTNWLQWKWHRPARGRGVDPQSSVTVLYIHVAWLMLFFWAGAVQ